MNEKMGNLKWKNDIYPNVRVAGEKRYMQGGRVAGGKGCVQGEELPVEKEYAPVDAEGRLARK